MVLVITPLTSTWIAGDHVGAGEARRDCMVADRRRGRSEIGADIGERARAEARELAVLVERELGLGDVVAACSSESRPSLRSAIHFTGRPIRRDAAQRTTYIPG